MKFVIALGLCALTFTSSSAFGAYSLSSYRAIPTGSSADTVAIGDVDGDGRNDVVLTTSTGNGGTENDYMVFVYLQNGDGSLAWPFKYRHGSGGPNGLALADLDRDGRMEIVVGGFLGITVVKVARDPRSKSLTLAWRHAYPGKQPASMVTAIDVNRDGALDIIGQDGSPGGATIYFGDGHGGISRELLLPTPVTAFNDLKTGDFNHDGFSDVAVLSGNTPTHAYVYYNDGSDDLSSPFEINPNPDAEVFNGALAAGDFNNDGLADLLMLHDDNNLSVFYQRAGGGFQSLALLPSSTMPDTLVGHDLDLDGRDDLIAAHVGGAQGFYLQGASGLGTEVVSDGPYATEFSHQGVAVGDINGDACNDIVNANYNFGLVIYLGHGCNAVADIAPSLGVSSSQVALRLDNFGTGEALAPQASISLNVASGNLGLGAIPSSCVLQSQTALAARLLCSEATLAAGTSRTLLIPFAVTGGSAPRNALTVISSVNTASVELRLDNNRASAILHPY